MLDSLLFVFQTNPEFYVASMALLGLFVGSFLNVVIYRLPVMMQRGWESQCRELLELGETQNETFNLVLPRSRCPHCGHQIGALEIDRNIALCRKLARFLESQR